MEPCQIRSAGIVPFSVFRKRVFVLLGKEMFVPETRQGDNWAAFGGSLEAGEDVVDGAAREFYEETAGCVMALAEARQRISQHKYLCTSDVFPKRGKAERLYFMYVPYKDYPTHFRNAKQFAQHVSGNVEIVEKSQLKWFSLQEIWAVVSGTWKQTGYRKQPRFRLKFADHMRKLLDPDPSDFETACKEAAR